MTRRSFVQAMVLFIAAFLAGWRPKPVLAKVAPPPPSDMCPQCEARAKGADSFAIAMLQQSNKCMSCPPETHAWCVPIVMWGQSDLQASAVLEPFLPRNRMGA